MKLLPRTRLKFILIICLLPWKIFAQQPETDQKIKRIAYFVEAGLGAFDVDEKIKIINGPDGQTGWYAGVYATYYTNWKRFSLNTGLRYQVSGDEGWLYYRFESWVIPLEMKFHLLKLEKEELYLIAGYSLNFNKNKSGSVQRDRRAASVNTSNIRLGFGGVIFNFKKSKIGFEGRFSRSSKVRSYMISSATFNEIHGGVEGGLWYKF